MWRWYTTGDKRKAAVVGLLIAIIGLSAVASGPIIAGSVMIMFRRRSLAGWFELGNALTILTDLWRQPGDPATAFGVDRLQPVLFWILSGAIMTMIVVGYVWFVRTAYRLLAPTGSGLASRADIARDLSPSACRGRARITRPDLTKKRRNRAQPAQLGIPLHQTPVGRADLWLPLENATGVIAPQQSGKTLMDLLHKVRQEQEEKQASQQKAAPGDDATTAGGDAESKDESRD